MDAILRDKSKAASAVFDRYESMDCQMDIVPFLLEKFDEQLALCDNETRDELLRVSAFATRLNALDTLIRESSEGEELSATKRKIAVTLLLGMIDEHRGLGPAVLSRFYFHPSAALGDMVREVIARRMEERDRDADTVAYELTLWHTAEVQISGRVFDERIVALTAKENDFWDSESAVKVEAVSLVVDHLRVATHLLHVAYVFLHTIISRYPGLNKELYAALVAEAETDDKFKLLVRYYDRKRERDMTRCEMNGIIALHGQFQHCLLWEKERALELAMKLFALCDDAKHALGYLQRIQLSLPEFFGEVCARVVAKREKSALFTELAKAAESLAEMHAKILTKKRTLTEFFEKHAHYTDEELRQLVESDVDIGASATITLYVWGRNEDYAKALSWLQDKGKTDAAFAKAHAKISAAREFLEELRDHLRRVYADVFGEEKAVEAEDDVFGKPKGKYVN